MNIEKILLIAGIICAVGMIALFVMHTALPSEQYELGNICVEKKELVHGEGLAGAYRKHSATNPFQEETQAAEIEVTIEPPDMPGTTIEPPPLLWNKEGF
jgi:hypothetical protein